MPGGACMNAMDIGKYLGLDRMEPLRIAQVNHFLNLRTCITMQYHILSSSFAGLHCKFC